MIKKSKIIAVLLSLSMLVLASCGSTDYKTDIKEKGGVYLEYKIEDSKFEYQDDFEDALELTAYEIRNRINGLGYTGEAYAEKDV